MAKKRRRRTKKHPMFTQLDEALCYFKTLIMMREKHRNEFFLRLKPFIDYFIGVLLAGKKMRLGPEEREDLRSEVYTYILEKWMVKLKKTSPKNTIASYLQATIRGLVSSFFVQLLRRPDPDRFERPQYTDAEPKFVREADFRFDRKFIHGEVAALVERHVRMRGSQGAGIRDVIERMMRYFVWKEYRKSGSFDGFSEWDSADSFVSAVSV